MKITAAVAAGLPILADAMDEPGTGIGPGLRQLTLDAAAAVLSYLGLSRNTRLTVARDHPASIPNPHAATGDAPSQPH